MIPVGSVWKEGQVEIPFLPFGLPVRVGGGGVVVVLRDSQDQTLRGVIQRHREKREKRTPVGSLPVPNIPLAPLAV